MHFLSVWHDCRLYARVKFPSFSLSCSWFTPVLKGGDFTITRCKHCLLNCIVFVQIFQVNGKKMSQARKVGLIMGKMTCAHDIWHPHPHWVSTLAKLAICPTLSNKENIHKNIHKKNIWTVFTITQRCQIKTCQRYTIPTQLTYFLSNS